MINGAIIVLIIVVWFFVLAPWLLRSQKPVNHTGEGFEDTRVLYSGEEGDLPAPRRPRLRADDVHASTEPEWARDAELVDAELVDAPDARASRAEHEVPGAVDGERLAGAAAVGNGRPQTVEGEVVEVSEVAAAQTDIDADSQDDDLLVDDAADTAPAAAAEDAGDGADTEAVAEFTRPDRAAAADAFEIDETFTTPVDLLYPGAVDSLPEEPSTENADAAHAAVDEDEGEAAEAAADAEIAVEADAAAVNDAAAESGEGLELSAAELEFARRRRGRGGWDPEADSQAHADRFQRRQRIVAGLAIAVVVTVALGIVVGGWTWALAAVVGAMTVIYLVALRNQTLAERELRRRRVAQLRRARLGVRNAQDEELAIPRKLRRPGAVILEADDASPDFDFLPVYAGGAGDDDFGGPHVVNRRELRDDLSARRVG